MDNQRITNRADLRKWRIELPNLVDDSDLDPYERTLYMHYVRVGNCYESTRVTATRCKMSHPQVVAKRKSLQEKGWITTSRNLYGTINVEVVDRWEENFAKFSKKAKKTGEAYRPEPNPVEQIDQWSTALVAQQRRMGMAGSRCTYCGGDVVELEHWIPVARGGTDDKDNLVLSCRFCNVVKGAMTGEEFVSLLVKNNRIVDSGQDVERGQEIERVGHVGGQDVEHKKEPIKNEPIEESTRAPENDQFHPRTIILSDEDIKNGSFHCACGKNHLLGDIGKDGFAPCGEAIIQLSDPKRKKSSVWQIAMAIADVCNLDLDMNGGQTFRFASELIKKAKIQPTVSLIKKHYGTGGWWYTDHWRGEKYSARPTLHGIRETWGQWDQKQTKRGFVENIQAGFDRYEEIKRGNRSNNQENPPGVLGEIPESTPRPESTGTNHSGVG